MFGFVKNKILESSFNRKFRFFNKYTRRAIFLKTNEELEKYARQCIEEIAQENKKRWSSLSLDDIYRVLCAIRKKTPGLLRKITLEQMMKIYKTTDKAGYGFNLIWAFAHSSPMPLMYIPLKLTFGRKIKDVFIIWGCDSHCIRTL